MMQSQIPYDFARILWRLFSFSCRSLAALICILHYKSNQPKNKLREKKTIAYTTFACLALQSFPPPLFSLPKRSRRRRHADDYDDGKSAQTEKLTLENVSEYV